MRIDKLFFLILFITLSSCSKEIELDLPEPDKKYVIEGYIENDHYPVIAVTRNSSYFAPIDSTYVMNLFVLDAKVYISNGENEVECFLSTNNLINGAWPYLYYTTNQMVGELDKIYSIKVIIGSDTITGSDTMPSQVFLDSLWCEPIKDNDTLKDLWISYIDPPEKNFYRFFTKRQSRDNYFVPSALFVLDDIYFNNQFFKVNLIRGIENIYSDSTYQDPELGKYKVGDTVIVKTANMTRQHYNFWRTAEQEIYIGSSPFINPVRIRHTVKGGLGVFGCYASTYDTIVIN
ncbi:MAG: DUF4249 family protein [Bacteroidales bacterium]|nr:DUF4249 family protein [Bacteroidales bacterium]